MRGGGGGGGGDEGGGTDDARDGVGPLADRLDGHAGQADAAAARRRGRGRDSGEFSGGESCSSNSQTILRMLWQSEAAKRGEG